MNLKGKNQKTQKMNLKGKNQKTLKSTKKMNLKV